MSRNGLINKKYDVIIIMQTIRKEKYYENLSYKRRKKFYRGY